MGRTTLRQPRVRRDALLDALGAARLGVVVAGGGYGKSLLADDHRERLGFGTARLALRPADADAAVLIANLQRSLRTGGLSDLAAALEGIVGTEDALDAWQVSLAARRDPVLVVIDDVHHAATLDAAQLVAALARSMPAPHRLLALGRSLPAGADDLARAVDAARLSTEDLAFTTSDVVALLDAFGVRLSQHLAAALRDATGGWPAALALWAGRIAAADDPEREAAAVASTPALVDAPLRELLRAMDERDRAAVVQLAHLPLLSDDVADAATAGAAVLERAAAAGLPFTPARPGWLRLPEPVAEHLVVLAPLDPDVAARAASRYAVAGEVFVALTTLMAAGRAEEAAAMLASLAPVQAERLSPAEMSAVVHGLPESALRAHPGALLQLARAVDAIATRSDALRRAERYAAERGDDSLARAVAAETALDFVRDGDVERARALASTVVDAARDDELATRARALDALGRIESLWGVDIASAERGGELLRDAAWLARTAGHPAWAAASLYRLAEDTLQQTCRYDEAIAAIDEALALLTARGRVRGRMLALKVDALTAAGSFDRADAVIDEARALAGVLGDDRLSGYVAWSELGLAAATGDVERARAAADDAARHRGDWFDTFAGLSYLLAAADCFDRLGDAAAAAHHLALAAARAGQDELDFQWHEAYLTARSGDPREGRQKVERALATAGRPDVLWRLRLLRAYAAHRAGDDDAAALAADAFAYCASLGIVRSRFAVERRAHDALLPLVSGADASTAPGGPTDETITIAALGRFRLMARGGDVLAVPPGRVSTAVKALVCNEGRLHAEALMELLWPEVDPPTGRARLRNLLNRVRSAAPGVVTRDGDVVALERDVAVDVFEFDDGARAAFGALRSGSSDDAEIHARAALARYRGPLLPDDLHEPWATSTRERLRNAHLRLLDFLAERSEQRDDIDEATRLLERALEEEPYDEVRYVRLARLFATQGRVGSAREVMERCRRALDELGLEPSLDVDWTMTSYGSDRDPVVRPASRR